MTVFGIGDRAQAELSEFWLDTGTKTIFFWKGNTSGDTVRETLKKRSAKTRVSNGAGRTMEQKEYISNSLSNFMTNLITRNCFATVKNS